MSGALEPALTYTPHTWLERTKEFLAAGFVVAFLTVQLLVPALKLAEPRAARFGWQMYSAVSHPVYFAVVMADGSIVDTHPRRFGRNDFPYWEIIPPQLCRQIPDARSVGVSIPARARQWEVTCP